MPSLFNSSPSSLYRQVDFKLLTEKTADKAGESSLPKAPEFVIDLGRADHATVPKSRLFVSKYKFLLSLFIIFALTFLMWTVTLFAMSLIYDCYAPGSSGEESFQSFDEVLILGEINNQKFMALPGRQLPSHQKLLGITFDSSSTK